MKRGAAIPLSIVVASAAGAIVSVATMIALAAFDSPGAPAGRIGDALRFGLRMAAVAFCFATPVLAILLPACAILLERLLKRRTPSNVAVALVIAALLGALLGQPLLGGPFVLPLYYIPLGIVWALIAAGAWLTLVPPPYRTDHG